MPTQKTVLASLLMLMVGTSTTVSANEDELSSSSYVEDGIAEQTLEQPNGDVVVPAEVAESDSNLVMGVSDEAEVALYNRSNRGNKVKFGLSYDTFDHKATGIILYPSLGEFETLRDYSVDLINLYVDGSFIIDQQFRVGGNVKFSVSTDVDYKVNNSTGLDDPSYSSFGAYVDWLYDPIFYTGAAVNVSSLDNKYRYLELGKDYSDTIDITSVTVYLGFENYQDLLTFSGQIGAAYVMYDYDSNVTPGVTPGYNLSSSSDSFGFYVSANAGYQLTQNIELGLGLSYMNYSMSSPDVSAQYQIRDYDMEASQLSINAGVTYQF
jgi:hypothetical protein